MGEPTKDSITDAIFHGSREILIKHGVDDDYWAKRLKRLSKAKKVDTFKGGETFFSEDGKPVSRRDEVIYSVPMDALDIQLKAIIQIGNHLGHVVTEKRDLRLSGDVNLLAERLQKIEGKDAE